MRLLRLILTGAAVLLFSSLHAAESGSAISNDWPQWRGPNRDGVSHETGWLTQWPAEGPKQLWKANIGAGYACISVSQNRVYSMGNINNEDVVSCLNADTGAVIWQHKYAAPLAASNYSGGPSATPTVDGDRVYTFSKLGVLFCLDAASGKVLWTKEATKETGALPPNWGFAGSVLIADDKAIMNVGQGGWAVNKMTGETAWKSADKPLGFANKGPSGYASPVLITGSKPLAVAIMTFNEMHAVSVADGKLLWKYPWATSFGENTPDPVIVDGNVLLSTGHGLGGALVKQDGEGAAVIWKNPKFGTHLNSAMLWDGYLYGFDGAIHKGTQSLTCVDAKTGETKWRQENFKGSAALADGKLIIVSLEGTLILVDASPAGFKELGRAQIFGKSWTQPILSNGRIYARSSSGDLVCLDVRK